MFKVARLGLLLQMLAQPLLLLNFSEPGMKASTRTRLPSSCAASCK